ncbi:hypothetical protein QAD02_020232 [Eretmocerus hayati]|uniref:Uncharacterized protein n=1 Tax=Eretmocerus hayati TaxID=131215 RepID=A0ACC2PLZ1_9HYME|nr:hypothetical protein QAD02_020232 [Eretmocerus hayati]
MRPPPVARATLILGVAYCCCALAPSLVAGEKEPTIISISKETSKELNSNVELNCTVQNPSRYSVMWNKLDKNPSDNTPISAEEVLIHRDARYSVKVDNNTSTYTLHIQQLKESDIGTYQCSIVTPQKPYISASVELQLRRPPVIFDNSTQQVTAAEGDDVKLHCNAAGYPVPVISWKRENNVLFFSGETVKDGKVLNIPNLSRDDRGVYICEADNTVGSSAHANVTVRVKFAPQISATKPRVGQAPGHDISLECNVEAYPPPTITWHRQGKELYKENYEGQSDEFVASFILYSVGPEKYGEYVCRAENELGSASTKLDLFETMVPACSLGVCH